ncbi:MAG: protein kinase [Verrucomicrobiota bacterium]
MKTGLAGSHEEESDSVRLEESADHIDNYRLLSVIGEGGFGVVWEAEQLAPVKRKVALKILRCEIASDGASEQFEMEKRALARLEHPNLARVYDAGTTSRGRPFFAMELIPGIPITAFCDQFNMSLNNRIRLFLQLCKAVQHAHQVGIIHRDLKPSNILVVGSAEEPVVRVIDFGVAKAIQDEENTGLSKAGGHHLFGSPLYLSPEQLVMSSQSIDTRTDVYSLGVVLYELLVGTTPLDEEVISSGGVTQLYECLFNHSLPSPATRLLPLGSARVKSLASFRSLSVAKWARSLKGDLTSILRRVLKRSRDERYQTAGQLADDLERFLRFEPVSAAPQTAAYRLKRFARRHRTVTMAMASILVVVFVGGVTSLWKAHEAESARESLEIALADSEAAILQLREQINRLELTNPVQEAALESRVAVIEEIRTQLATLDEQLTAHRERNGLLLVRLDELREAEDTIDSDNSEVRLKKSGIMIGANGLQPNAVEVLELEIEEQKKAIQAVQREMDFLLTRERDLLLELQSDLAL